MEIFRALGSLAEPPSSDQRRLAGLLELGPLPPPEAYSDLFLFQLYPYASVYLGAEGMLGGEARDRIAGFWRALDRTPPAEPDHLAVLLALYARLAELEEETAGEENARQGWRRARSALLHEHLVSWLGAFLRKLDELAPPFYAAWGGLLAASLAGEVERLGAPDRLPLHLREAPPLADPQEEGGEAFLAALLSPVRSGLVLTRSDLERAARELGLGVRIGERRWVLKALLSQDPAATLGWLAREAERWRRDDPERAWVAGVTGFWTGRAARTARLAARASAAAGPLS